MIILFKKEKRKERMQNCHSRQKERQKEYSVAHVYRAIKYTFAHVINVYQVHWVVVYMYICIYTYVYIYIQICHPLTTATRPPSAAPPRRTMIKHAPGIACFNGVPIRASASHARLPRARVSLPFVHSSNPVIPTVNHRDQDPPRLFPLGISPQ